METHRSPSLPLPRQLSRILDDYRSRIDELRDPERFMRTGMLLAAASEERVVQWEFARAVLAGGPERVGVGEPDDRVRVAERVLAGGAVPEQLKVFGKYDPYLVKWGSAQAIFEHEGRNVYEVGNGLAERLAHTELRGLTLDEVRLPFQAIYLTIPPGAGLTFDDGRPLQGAYLVESPEGTGGISPHRVLSILTHGPGDPSLALAQALAHGLEFQLGLPPGEPVESVLQCAWKPRPGHTPPTLAGTTYAEACLWFLNVVLYLTMPGARVEVWEANRERAALQARIAKLPAGAKRVRLQERLKREAQDHRIQVGRGIPYEGTDARIPGGRARPSHVIRVPGHWKMQPHGPGSTLRKRIHIEPHWRNLDAALAPVSTTRVASLAERSAATPSPVALS
jgi:hypothetical protein